MCPGRLRNYKTKQTQKVNPSITRLNEGLNVIMVNYDWQFGTKSTRWKPGTRAEWSQRIDEEQRLRNYWQILSSLFPRQQSSKPFWQDPRFSRSSNFLDLCLWQCNFIARPPISASDISRVMQLTKGPAYNKRCLTLRRELCNHGENRYGPHCSWSFKWCGLMGDVGADAVVLSYLTLLSVLESVGLPRWESFGCYPWACVLLSSQIEEFWEIRQSQRLCLLEHLIIIWTYSKLK